MKFGSGELGGEKLSLESFPERGLWMSEIRHTLRVVTGWPYSCHHVSWCSPCSGTSGLPVRALGKVPWHSWGINLEATLESITPYDLKATNTRIYGGVSSKPTTGVSHACVITCWWKKEVQENYESSIVLYIGNSVSDFSGKIYMGEITCVIKLCGRSNSQQGLLHCLVSVSCGSLARVIKTEAAPSPAHFQAKKSH